MVWIEFLTAAICLNIPYIFHAIREVKFNIESPHFTNLKWSSLKNDEFIHLFAVVTIIFACSRTSFTLLERCGIVQSFLDDIRQLLDYILELNYLFEVCINSILVTVIYYLLLNIKVKLNNHCCHLYPE